MHEIFALFCFMILFVAAVSIFLSRKQVTLTSFYRECILLGFASGCWALFITITTEQFGTNIRATVTTTVPNFVRGAVVPLSSLFRFISDLTGSLILAGLIGGFLCLLFATISLYRMNDTFVANLDYNED
ncbi:hypothetical protein [Mucilaginibacter rubeus]|uniref:MFS transporter n=1 Tax=Mucilaginibacter rubeus TaxID=2027860 RepID=A0A5C1I8Q4_9SPHI|nr:hypothetical protein [Mucilaginibacter rubeus]QEM14254.1 MFS transporter [Mucilaginibacter rubeus]